MCHRVSRVKLKFKVIEAAKAIEIHRRLSGSDKDSFTKLTPATFGRGLGLARVLTPVRPDDAALLPESFKSANAVHGGEEGGYYLFLPSLSSLPSTVLPVQNASRVSFHGIVKTLSLSLSIERARPRLRLEGGSMKNDDAALVKEMKSGLVPREKERGGKAEGWKTERSTEGVYCLRSRSVEQKGIRPNSMWQRNNSRPALRNDPCSLLPSLLEPPSFHSFSRPLLTLNLFFLYTRL